MMVTLLKMADLKRRKRRLKWLRIAVMPLRSAGRQWRTSSAPMPEKCSKPRKRSTGRRLKPSSTRISVCYQKPSACSGRPNTMQRSIGHTEHFVTIHEESDEVFFEPCRVATLQRLLLRRSPLSWTLTTRRILSRSTLWTFKM